MKEKLTDNLGIKLLSLLLASIMWIVIVNLDDPMKSREFKGVAVEILNEDDIESLDKMYEIVEGSTVDITVRGKRSVIDKLRSTDMKATADLANRYIADPDSKILNVHIDAICTKNTSSSVDVRITGAAQVLKIALEDIDTKQFKVTINQNGTVEEGFAIGSITAKPNMVEVTGAKSQIARIAEVRVSMDVTGISENVRTKLKPRVYDEKGKEIDSAKMKFSSPEIMVSVQLLKTKTVPIYIDVKGEPSYGYQYVAKDYEPKQITIAATQQTLNKVDGITIPVDISNAISDVEKEIELLEYLPEKVTIAEETRTVTIKITIEKLEVKKFILSPQDILIRNLKDGMKFNYASINYELVVEVMGLKEDLKVLTKESLGSFIDLQDLAEGKHNVIVQFTVEEKYQVVVAPSLNIEITASESPDNSPNPTQLPNETNTPLPNTTPSVGPEEEEE